MSLLIPLQDDETEFVTNRFRAPFAVSVTREMDAQQAVLAADIKSGDGTVVMIDIVSDVFEAAR